MKIIDIVADHVLRAIAPRGEALAACSGVFYVCGSFSADCYDRTNGRTTHRYFRCRYKPNCTDTCSQVGCCD
jgi:hypothetical protein